MRIASSWAAAGLFTVLAALPVRVAESAPVVETVPIDLLPLIEAAAVNPEQFAVQVPFSLSAAKSGEWSQVGSRSIWTHAVRIRDAVSLSFHAPRFQLPPSAVLTVRGTRTTATYRASDMGDGDFWSRVQPGDMLEFSLDVAAVERSRVLLEISSFQAGYRGLSPEVKSHASLGRKRAMAAGSPDTPCVQNYACNVTSQNAAPGKATVGLLVGNLYQCTGTMINTVARNQKPYLLTARHCQTGRYGGGNPGIAAAVTVYWNAQTDCGAPLDTVFYSTSAIRQTGATTVFEQQDVWLMELSASPVVDDAQLSGFDASGSPVVGGYSIHHALSYGKQFTRWHGTAFVQFSGSVLGTNLVSTLLHTVNEFGVPGPGASGGALFSQNDRAVGVMSLGRISGSQSGYGNCPVASPPEPSADDYESAFNALSGIWTRTDDTTSSTGSRTLQSLLDPAGTGATSVGSDLAVRLTFTASALYAKWGDPVTLSWNAPAGASCLAGGGIAGDGWSGQLSASGARQVTVNSATDVTYRLGCALPSGANVSAEVLVRWSPPYAIPLFRTSVDRTWTNRPVTLSWNSILGPCAISGGGLTLSDLPTSGSTQVTSATPADHRYVLNCGTSPFTMQAIAAVSFSVPNVDFEASGLRRLKGESLVLHWDSLADSCVPTGGVPGDNWNNTVLPPWGSHEVQSLDEAGTFEIGLTCVAGPLSLRKSISVVVEDGAPFVTLVPLKDTVTLTLTPADLLSFRFATNLSTCEWDLHDFPVRSTFTDPVNHFGAALTEGVWGMGPQRSGQVNVTLICRSARGPGVPAVSATATATVLPPAPATVSMTASTTRVIAGGNYLVNWSSNNTIDCNVSVGGIQITGGVNGTLEFTTTRDDRGIHSYLVDCTGLDPAAPHARAGVQVEYVRGDVELAGPASVEVGQSFTLSWNESAAERCTASGGGANGSSWTGNLQKTGDVTIVASRTGSFTYTLQCFEGGVPKSASVVVNVVRPGSGGSSGGGGAGGSPDTGGGGAWSLLELLLLAGALATRSLRLRLH